MEVGVEWRTRSGRIFRFADTSGLEVILKIGVVSGFPLVLPPNVVRVAIGPANLVVSNSLQKGLTCSAS